MSAWTESLIRSIQTNDSLAFYGWLHTLKGTPDLDAGVAGDPGITPLAVASVMYSKAIQSDPLLATRYATMIEALMDAGANPLVQIGKLERRRVGEGRTLAEVCGGVLCPAMQAWFGRQRAGKWSNTALHRPHPAYAHLRRNYKAVA